MHRLILPILAGLTVSVSSSCTTPIAPAAEVPQRRAIEAVETDLNLPPMKIFTRHQKTKLMRSNTQIAQDFLDLSFQMESGSRLPFLTRFEGPVRVKVVAPAPKSLHRDLSLLLARLRSEAKLDIALAKSGEEAQIFVDTKSRAAIQRAVPQAACFVVPNVSGWRDFKRKRSAAQTDWRRLQSRQRATVIVPSDVSPQEVRDCLHEEIAQALGPLNDLYRLPDSTFNDSNFHTVLTSFDMLLLRIYYAPQMYNGITRAEAARILPGLLARINPAGVGRGGTGNYNTQSSKEWQNAISNALSLDSTKPQQATQAALAVSIAKSRGWQDNRLAFSYFVQGRASLASHPEEAISAFLNAGRLYKSLYGKSVHTAYVATQMAAFALSSGQNDVALKLVDDAIKPAYGSQNAALLSTLLMIKSEALAAKGDKAQARKVRLDSLGWARYGFGAAHNVRARLSEIEALSPHKTRS